MRAHTALSLSLLALALWCGAAAASPYEVDPDVYNAVCGRGGEYPYCTNAGYKPPLLDADDVVVVQYMEAPLFFSLMKDLLGDVHLYHAGIGFHSTKTGLNFTVEYDAVQEVMNATFPFIVPDGKGGQAVVFCNQGAVCIDPQIAHGYWEVYFPAGTISGDVFNKLFAWIPQANETYSVYQTWNVFREWPRMPSLFSFTCADFAFAVLGKIIELGGKLTLTELPHDYINMYGVMNSTAVDMNDPVQKQAVISYWEHFDFARMSGVKKFERLVEYIVNDKYILYNNEFYSVRAQAPFVTYHYAKSALCAYPQWATNRCGVPPSPWTKQDAAGTDTTHRPLADRIADAVRDGAAFAAQEIAGLSSVRSSIVHRASSLVHNGDADADA